MCRNQLIYHFLYGVNIKFTSGMGIHHGCLIDSVQSARMCCFDRQELCTDVGHVHSHALGRERAYMAGMDTIAVHKAGNFHACFLRQVADEVPCVEDIAADLVRCVRHNGFHNVGSIFPGALMCFDTRLKEFFVLFLPGFDLVDTAARILVQRDVVALDELRIAALDIEAVVLGVVLARLGAVVAEVADVVEADLVLKFGIRYFGIDAGLDLGIEVVAVSVPDIKEPCHVVDAGDQLFAAFQLVFHADGGQQVLGADLDAVAETDGPDAGVSPSDWCN